MLLYTQSVCVFATGGPVGVDIYVLYTFVYTIADFVTKFFESLS